MSFLYNNLSLSKYFKESSTLGSESISNTNKQALEEMINQIKSIPKLSHKPHKSKIKE